MTPDQAFHVACLIYNNEGREVKELKDHEICEYLIDVNQEETDENVQMVRNA